MLKMHLAAGLAAAALMTTAAVAQTNAPTVPAGQGQLMTQMPPDMMRGTQLTRLDVYGADNQRIGGIDEVILDRQGKIQAIVVGIGGFLGIGEKNVAIPYDQVRWMTNQEVQAQNNQGSGQGGGGGAAGGSGGGAGGTAATTGNTAGGAGGGAGGTTASTSNTLGGAGGAGGTATSGAGGSTGAPAGAGGAAGTSTAGGTGGDANMPARAMVRMTKADLQNAPEFRYNADQGNQSGGGASGAGGTTAPRP